MNNGVIILDFGSQYTQLIARRVRELHVFSEILPCHTGLDQIRAKNPQALILSGGPASVYSEGAPRIGKELLELGVPILGICYGLQLLALVSGMKVEAAGEREYGLAKLQILGTSPLLKGIPDQSKVWMSHGDKISDFPRDFRITGRTDNSEIAVLESPERRIFGVQFHPEVVHTPSGKDLLANFLFSIAGITPDWNMENFIQQIKRNLREKIGKEKVILGLSGGVDSTVLALLLRESIGDQLLPVFVDTGLLRRNEFRDLMQMFRDHLRLHVHGEDASVRFLKNLRGVRSPEQKRKIIGKTFIDVFTEVEKRIGPVKFFAQGTLYPDVIESVSVKGPSATIKSHHNVGGLPEYLKWELVEPLRELFKDEVREIGRQLHLDERFLHRHPFPGPGLAVRILGAVSRPKIRMLQEADHIFIEELRNFGLYDKTWQAFSVLLPVKSVGVMGDERTYENALILRAVESVDGMTADWFPAPVGFLKHVSNRIVNEVKGINRVAYDLTSKPPGTIEWE